MSLSPSPSPAIATVNAATPLGANTTSNIATIWKSAVDRYEQITKVKIQNLAQASNVDDILNNIHEQETKFKDYRHSGSKPDKFRTLVKKCLDPINKVGDIVASAASTSFPPSTAIFTAIRFLITSANAVSADYDKLTGFFEDLDLYLSRLKILEKWIPPIPELEIALVQVLTSVLVLCGICAKYVKMKRLVKAFRNLLSGEDDELSTAYAQFHKMVEQENGAIRNATLTAVEQLKKENSAVHTDIKTGLAALRITERNTEELINETGRMHTYLQNQETASERERVLDHLSSLDFHDKQRDVSRKHHQGTGQWLLGNHKFREWCSSNHNSILWCPGIPGAGKTVITSAVINHIQEAFQRADIAIAFFYCDYQDRRTQSEVEFLSSITRQLAEQTHPLLPEIKMFCSKGTRRKVPTDEERMSLLKSICTSFNRTYLIVDALDICPELNREKFVRLIKDIEPFVRVFITSRPHLELQLKFANIIRVDIWADSSDIEAYLKSEINTNGRLCLFCAKDPDLEKDIIRSVTEKAAGMFLLVHLQIGRLCRQTNLRSVRRNMAALPVGIFATYEETIERIEEQLEDDSFLAKKMLSYIFCAKRPLLVQELRHALALEAGDTEVEEAALPEIEILLTISAGLVRIDTQSNTARLVHYTLQEYFQQNREKLLPDMENEFARTCLTYLSLEAFESGPCGDGEMLDQRLETYRFLDYASHYWGYHVTEDQLWMDLLLTYLQNNQKVSSAVQVLHLIPYRTVDWQNRFPKHFGPLHVCAYWGFGMMLSLFLDRGMEIDSQDSYGTTALQLAAKYGHQSVAQMLLNSNADINAENRKGETSLYWAARNGHKDMIGLLLSRGANIMTKDNEGWSALDWAVIGGKNDVVEVLLKHGIDTEDDGRNKALFLAAGEGHEVTVQMLLDNGADVNAKDWIGSTAMDWAAPGGHETAVRVLLQNGSDLASRDTYQNTALHWAVQHEAIVRVLLEHGADVNAKNDCGQTALCWAARDGTVAVAELLISYAAEIDLQDSSGCTALHGAALRGYRAMLELLLSHGADPNLRDKDGWTCLHAAALRGHKELAQVLLEKIENGQEILDWVALQQQDGKKNVLLGTMAEEKAEGSTVLTGLRSAVQERQLARLQMLLDKGADINAKDAGGWTALIIAAENGYEEVVKLLLRNGADVNVSGRNDWPALHWASEYGQEEVVQLLVEHGAHINASKNGWTPMLLAVKNGYMSIFQFLLKGGANINAEDYHGRRALHWAARHGDREMVWLVVGRVADINVTDHWGRTALIWAIENKQEAVATLLLAIGANVDTKTRDGSTALHIAVYMQETALVQQLLKRGASVETSTRDGFTPLHIAALVGSGAASQLLLNNGADQNAEVRWQVVDNREEDEDSVLDRMEAKSLSTLLRELLLKKGLISEDEADVPQVFTVQQLAHCGGHRAVERLLRKRKRMIAE